MNKYTQSACLPYIAVIPDNFASDLNSRSKEYLTLISFFFFSLSLSLQFFLIKKFLMQTQISQTKLLLKNFFIHLAEGRKKLHQREMRERGRELISFKTNSNCFQEHENKFPFEKSGAKSSLKTSKSGVQVQIQANTL